MKQCLNGVVPGFWAATLVGFWERTALRVKGLGDDLRDRSWILENGF